MVSSRGIRGHLGAGLLLAIGAASACSLSVDDYDFVDPQAAGAGGEASVSDTTPVDGIGGADGAAPTNLDNGGFGGGAGAGGAGGMGTAGSAVVPPDATKSWDSPGTLWDTATWN